MIGGHRSKKCLPNNNMSIKTIIIGVHEENLSEFLGALKRTIRDFERGNRGLFENDHRIILEGEFEHGI